MASVTAHRPPMHDWRTQAVVTFAGQYDTHIKTGEDYKTLSLADIFKMQPGNSDKGSGLAFIPSTYSAFDAREHAKQRESGMFVALCGDVDSGDHDLEEISYLVRKIAGDSAWLIYTSAHSRPDDTRWRIVLPLDRPVAFDGWHDAQEAFFSCMEAAGVRMDHAMSRAAQPVYLPNVPALHAKSGTPLRGENGEALYYQCAVSRMDAPGLDIGANVIGAGVAEIQRKRVEDDKERARIRQEAMQRRAQQPQGDSASVIVDFNAANSVATILELCGYEQSPRSPEDWRSPQQTGETYATRIIGDKWVSLSASDVACGVGEKCKSGCFGDAYDLFVHYKHRGDHKSAFRALHAERRESQPNVIYPPAWAQEAPPYDEMPEWAEWDGGACNLDDLDAHVASSVKAAPENFANDAKRLRESEWKPVDLWARYEAPPLPSLILPPVIERFAVAQADSMGVDPGGVAMSALAVCAAATPDRIQLQVKRHDPTWKEAARLWVALIGNPSTKKTPMMSAAMRPLHKIDTQMFREFTVKQEIYDALPAQERKSAPKPPQRRLRISDATVEAAQEVLKDSPDGVLSQQDELSGWFGAMDKYSAGKGAMADRSFWLQSFNGGSYALNRVARGASLIPNLSICVLGGIQPDPLRRIVSDAVDDGLIQRLLPVILKPAVLGKDEPQDASVRDYDDLVNRLWLLSPPPGADGDGILRFSDEAQLIRRELEERHLEMAAAEVISPKLASHFGKYDGIFARLCVLWHCIENADAPILPAIVQGDTTKRAAKFLHGYIVPNAIAFYTSVLGLSDDHGALIELASYILAHRLETIQHRDTQRATATLKALTADQSRKLFEKLEALGWLEPTPPPPNSNTPRWRVNPAVHDLFAERGRKEKESREKARAAIMTVLGKEA